MSLPSRGHISEWTLLVTDYANQIYIYYMDILGVVEELPKYGTLYVEERDYDSYLHVEAERKASQTTRSLRRRNLSYSQEGYGQLVADTNNLKKLEPGSVRFRLLGDCYGVDTTSMTGVEGGVVGHLLVRDHKSLLNCHRSCRCRQRSHRR